MKKIITTLALLLALLAPVSAFAQAPERLSTKAATQLDKDGKTPEWWTMREQQLVERAQAGGFGIMFIGDSITHQWEAVGKAVWAQKLAPLGAQPFGIGGDRTENLLWRLQHGLLSGKSDPKLVVMMIGTNNTGHRKDKPEDIAAGVKACIDTIRQRKPDAKILVLAIFPRSAQPSDFMRMNNEAANKLLSAFADGKKVFYADINHIFLTKDGVLEKSVMPDLLHLSAASYDLWADAVIPEIKKIAGGK